MLQGGYVRPSLAKQKVSELTFSYRGVVSCAIALGLMAVLPLSAIRDSALWSKIVLWTLVTCLSYTSSTAVTGLMASAAGCCDEDDAVKGKEGLPRGRSLGKFRSAGQLGRALGPLLATSMYWVQGPTVTYAVSCVALLALAGSMSSLLKEERARQSGKKIL